MTGRDLDRAAIEAQAWLDDLERDPDRAGVRVERAMLEPALDPSRPIARWLALAALLGVLAGAVIALSVLAGGAEPPESPASAWRTDYDRGWAYLVDTQRREPRPDELTRAECRWWAQGDGRDLVEQWDAFVAGCDTAARMTPLEGS